MFRVALARRALRWSAIVTLAACALPAVALRDVTQGELALTPAFCQDVQSINGWTKEVGTRSPRAEHWLSLMGETFWAMHHYCWGLIKMQRARAPGATPQVRAFLRRSAIDEYQYVLRHSPPEFVLLPEIYYRIGESYVALEQPQLALIEFEKSRAVKADYWPAYAAAAESLLALGRRDEARRMVAAGLEQVPDQQTLTELAQRISSNKLGAAPKPRP